MLTRSKTNTKREYFKRTLRQRCQSHLWAVGQPVPGVRDLAAEFELSRDVVSDLLKELEKEGLLYTLPRMGTFVGRPASAEQQTYLMVYGPNPLQSTTGQLVKMGFEDRLSELGAMALTIETSSALELQRAGTLLVISGVLDYSRPGEFSSDWLEGTPTPDLPRVGFGARDLTHPKTDFVAFDDIKGGRQATEHLLERGNKNIAFLAFHAEDRPHEYWGWSRDREQGWREAMKKAGVDLHLLDTLAFHPQESVFVEDTQGIDRVMLAPVEALLRNRTITAVVAANDAVAHCLVDGLQRHEVPKSQWPAIVGFDGSVEVAAQLLTSLRMPWTEIGRAAADLLWSRANAQPDRKPQIRRFPMRMVTRLSCRPKWSSDVAPATLALARAS